MLLFQPSLLLERLGALKTTKKKHTARIAYKRPRGYAILPIYLSTYLSPVPPSYDPRPMAFGGQGQEMSESLRLPRGAAVNTRKPTTTTCPQTQSRQTGVGCCCFALSFRTYDWAKRFRPEGVY